MFIYLITRGKKWGVLLRVSGRVRKFERTLLQMGMRVDRSDPGDKG